MSASVSRIFRCRSRVAHDARILDGRTVIAPPEADLAESLGLIQPDGRLIAVTHFQKYRSDAVRRRPADQFTDQCSSDAAAPESFIHGDIGDISFIRYPVKSYVAGDFSIAQGGEKNGVIPQQKITEILNGPRPGKIPHLDLFYALQILFPHIADHRRNCSACASVSDLPGMIIRG